MASFAKGDMVLIINGIDDEHRTLIGHATTITGGPISSFPPGVNTHKIPIYFVEETEVMRIGPDLLMRFVYRAQDLMPLKGDDQEVTREETETET